MDECFPCMHAGGPEFNPSTHVSNRVMVAQAYDSSTGEVETAGSLELTGSVGSLPGEFQANERHS